jgi:preprotein translocase subunit SecY
MAIIPNAEKYKRRIAGDIVTVGATVGALVAILVNVAPAVHLPAGATSILVAASTVIATVVQQARRVARQNKAVKVAAEQAAVAKPVKKAPAKKAAAVKKTAK